MDLKLLQQSFIKAILDLEGNSADIESIVQSDRLLSATQRLNIYKSSMLGNFISILKDAYPVCDCLVGEQYFSALCQRFISGHPNYKPDITQYGDAFSDFLQTFEPVQQQCIYLADVACLEWACRQALDSPESSSSSEVIDLAALAKIPESKQGSLIFHLPKDSTLIESRYPILDIWKSNQSGFAGDKEIDLGLSGDRLIVFRQEWALLIHPLDVTAYDMLEMLSESLTFERVSVLLLEKYDKINIAEIFSECIKNGWIVGFCLADEIGK